MSDMSFLVYGMLFDRLPADWTNAFWNIGDHCLLWPCEINEYTLLMQRRAIVIKGGIMAKTNDWICFSFNCQKFFKLGFFFFFFSVIVSNSSSILLHRERNPRNRIQIETRFKYRKEYFIMTFCVFKFFRKWIEEQSIRKQIKFRLLFRLNDNKIVSQIYNVFSVGDLDVFV